MLFMGLKHQSRVLDCTKVSHTIHIFRSFIFFYPRLQYISLTSCSNAQF